MSNGLIVRPIPLAASQVSVSGATWGVNAAFPIGNIVDRQPKVVAQTNPASSGTSFELSILIDLGADTAFDTVAVMWTNLSMSATWNVFGSPAAAGGSVLSGGNQLLGTTGFGVAPTTRENRRHGLWTTATPVSRRYIEIKLIDTRAANPEQLIRAGVLVIGQRLAPTWNFELGSGRKVETQSIRRTLPGGETHTEKTGRVPIWRATWSNLSEAEMRAVWSIMMEVADDDPLLLIEEPDAVPGQAEGMHWSLLDALDFFEREQIDKQRIDLRARELV